MKPLTLAVIFAGSVLGGAAFGGSCGYDYCWGAVGFGPDGAYGYSYSHSNEDIALEEAQAGCGGDCTELRSFYNICGAMAVGSDGAWGFGLGDTGEDAEYNAVGYCAEYGSGCAPIVWACSQ